MKPKHIIFPSLLLLLAACARSGSDEHVDAAAEATPAETAEQAAANEQARIEQLKTTTDGIFSVALTLSPKAQERIKASGEKVIVETVYFGDPKPGYTGETNEFGQITLGTERVETTSAGTLSFDGKSLNKDHLNGVGSTPGLMINTYSSDRSNTDPLNCDFFMDNLDVANKAPVQIHCKLFSEAQ